jgi:hypothetical protein
VWTKGTLRIISYISKTWNADVVVDTVGVLFGCHFAEVQSEAGKQSIGADLSFENM